MNLYVGFRPLACNLIVWMVLSFVADERKILTAKELHTSVAMKQYAWWKVCVKEFTYCRSIQRIEENSDLTLNIDRNSNESAFNFGVLDRNGSAVHCRENDFRSKIVNKIADEVLQGGVPKDHPAAVGEEGPEEKHVDIGRTRQGEFFLLQGFIFFYTEGQIPHDPKDLYTPQINFEISQILPPEWSEELGTGLERSGCGQI